MTASDLKETEAEYIFTMAVSGFEPGQIAVSVEPHCVAVWAGSKQCGEGEPDTDVRTAVPSAKEMFCQYRLPHLVVVEDAKAVCDSGELSVTLPSELNHKRRIPSNAPPEWGFR